MFDFIGSLVIIAVCILLSAFFSSPESAFLTIQKTSRLNHLINIEDPRALKVSKLLEDPGDLLSIILLGNNLVNVTFTATITGLAISLINDQSFAILIATIVGTVVLLIAGEILPKTIAIKYAETLVFIYSKPLNILSWIFLPILFALRSITKLSRVFEKDSKQDTAITEDELRSLIDIGESEGVIETKEAELLESVFKFGDKEVREVITPRTEMIFVPNNSTIQEFLNTIAKHTHTRYPVFKQNNDNIIGIISAKDVLKSMSFSQQSLDLQSPLTDVIRDAYFVPETKSISELFDELRKTGNQMAIAIDEFGGIAGLVTIKGLLEEIVGSVGEEGTTPNNEYETIGTNTYKVDGGIDIDNANNLLGANIPDGDYETLAGFVLYILGDIPSEGEFFNYRNFRLEIISMNEMKIEKVKLTILKKSNNKHKT